MGKSYEIVFWKKYRRAFQLTAGILVAMLILLSGARAQSDAGFIYGKVYTIDNVYQGQIRWGKEEAFWNDIFNGAKLYKNNYGNLPKKEDKDASWFDFDWRLSSIWEDKYSGTSHQFSCQFGDIKAIEVEGDSRIALLLKNGVTLDIGGEGYNDIGEEVVVLDQELGLISVRWNRLRKIEFLPTPKTLKAKMGEPLFGTVETVRKGDYTGFIQWDHDERLGPDKLDGDTRDGDVSIEFNHIKKIERYREGSQVTLNSGRGYYLTGSNDVNSGNRGVIVSVDGVGKISVPWRAFVKVEFNSAPGSGAGYDTYTVPHGLAGTVKLYEGRSITGKIVYDLDESWELEMLEGRDDEIEYNIPFRNIRKITPKNYDYSLIELKNGQTVLLGGMRDVSESNDGILVFKKGEKEPEYVNWRDITEIVFD